MAVASDSFSVGDLFTSFDELQQSVEKYQKKGSLQFYIRDSRSMEAALKRNTKKQLKPDLKYAEITYCCIYGGKKYKATTKGKRPHQLWTQQFYKSSHLVNIETEVSVNQGSEFISTCSSSSAKKILSQNEKYRTAYNIAQKLASLLSESSGRDYRQKLSILKDIVSIWESGVQYIVQECNEESEFDNNELHMSEVPDQRMPIPPLSVVEVAKNSK
uniref:ZSWIM3 N-terminal domain-containing protein n=1 Tax=Amphimedon queenslandica TaxID=400682 RepID=A0A1X7USG1_AMPQE